MPGLFIQRHAEVSSRLAHTIVLYVGPGGNDPPEIVHTVENQIDTIRVYFSPPRLNVPLLNRAAGLQAYLRACLAGYRFISMHWGMPALVHVNVLTRMGVVALYLKKLHGITYVITEHWSRYLPGVGTFKGLFRKVFTRLVVRNAAAVSTVSRNLAKAMQAHNLTNPNYLILPNVVDTNRFAPAKLEESNPVKTILHVSCFEDQSKNITGMLRVISRLTKVRNDFRFVLVGDGIDYERIKQFAETLELREPVVHFAGLLENEKVIDAYQQSDFMLMFSNYENMPVVISECFSCGLPVVCTNVGGIAEYVNEQNGLLVEPRDEDALFEALQKMLDSSRNYDRKMIRQSAENTFSQQAVELKMRELYNKSRVKFS